MLRSLRPLRLGVYAGRQVAEMALNRPRREIAQAWPTLRTAAMLIGVSPSTLSRRKNLPIENAGHEKRLRPELVLDLARHYRKSVLNEVGAGLIDFAAANAPEHAAAVEASVEEFFAAIPQESTIAPEALADLVSRYLPSGLAREVRRVILDQTQLSAHTSSPSLQTKRSRRPRRTTSSTNRSAAGKRSRSRRKTSRVSVRV